ncbi:embigin [Spea bombifrons]|uniref:embigin n=1 Tax=Spea bombifrons TaxID=233779 RepID=UPI00234AAA7B|nr:embigin [Spea bombifrons]
MVPSPVRPVMVSLFCGLLSMASPGTTGSKPGPDLDIHASQNNIEHVSNIIEEKHSILIPDLTSKALKKNITIDNPVRLSLDCYLLVDLKDFQMGDVTWKHGNGTLSRNSYTYNNTENTWHTSYEFIVTDNSKIGTYTCIFNSTAEVRAEFHINVPNVRSENKPLVSYKKDTIVMKCDSAKYTPVEWIWYHVNGSDQVQLNSSSAPNKYEICQKKPNETKLHISDLSEEDDGIYICKAVFKIGEQHGEIQLTILSYMVPLKVFLAIAAEVVILVSVIFICEVKTKKRPCQADGNNDAEQTTQLKSETSSTLEASTTRQRK